METSISSLAEQLYNGIDIRTRKYLFKKYPKVFLGTDAVIWLIRNGHAENEEAAIRTGQKMLEDGHFVHCLRDHEFKNEKLFYRFLKDEENKGKLAEPASGVKSWKEVFETRQGQLLNTAEIKSDPELDQSTDLHNKNEEIPEILIDLLNAELLDEVRPLRWTDPTPEGVYNIVAIGAGAGGLVSALGCAGVGGKSAICEKGYFGGDCLNTGCVPSKAFIKAAKAAHSVKSASKYGITVDGFKIDFEAVMRSVREKRAHIGHHDSVYRFIKTYGVDIYLGTAQFTSKNTIMINGKELKFAKAVVATGGRPRVPKIPGIDKVRFFTSENVFNITEQPKNVVVIGGGPIGAELGQAFNRLGSSVTFLMRSDKFLAKEDPEAAQIVEDKLTEEGVIFIKEIEFLEIKISNPAQPHIATLKIKLNKTGELVELPTDCLLLAAGRIPNVENIGLEKAGIEYDLKTGVKISKKMRTTNSNVYAVGDCCQGQQFTHMADAMARGVIRNACFFGAVNYKEMIVPRVTYTDPELAQVGRNKSELELDGVKYDEYVVHFKDNDRAICDGEDYGFVKVYTKKGKEELLGCVIVCPRAGEMIGEAALAMQNGVKISGFGQTIHPYPSYGEGLKQIGDAFTRTKLTNNAKGLLRTLLKARR